jgi:hypothetical protein
MLDDAALALEEIAPEDRRFDPGTASWWISLAYAVRRTESVERAEAILLRAQAMHPKVAMIAFNLACYASVAGGLHIVRRRSPLISCVSSKRPGVYRGRLFSKI